MACPIAEENNEYVKKLFEDLFKEGIKCEMDLRNEKINYKVREHSLAILFIFALQIQAQELPKEPKVGLVLSGGGAKGKPYFIWFLWQRRPSPFLRFLSPSLNAYFPL